MEKIKSLLGDLGASDELSNALCEEFERYTQSLKEKYEGILRDKIKEAKSICVEEVQREKVNLARKVAVFLESKVNAIEQAAAKQRVVEESEASSVLKRAKAILEDVKIDESDSRELLALKKKLSRLERAASTLREERDRMVQKANKANEIAVKVLDKNKLLEQKLSEAGVISEGKKGSICECGAVIPEDVYECPSCGKTVVTGKDKKAAEKNEGKSLPPEFVEQQKKAKAKAKDSKDEKDEVSVKVKTESKARLDSKRTKSATPKSTRHTLAESVATRRSAGSDDISKIAEEMPEY